MLSLVKNSALEYGLISQDSSPSFMMALPSYKNKSYGLLSFKVSMKVLIADYHCSPINGFSR